MKLKAIKIPHVFIFLSYIIFFCAILTYVVPSGSFDREQKTFGSHTQTVVVPGSYKQLDKHYSVKGLIFGEKIEGKATPISVLSLFTSIPRGMSQAASLIFFVFIIGAVFKIIQATGTIQIVMFEMMERFKKHPYLLFFGIYLVVSMGSSFMGMSAEFIPLIPLFLLIAKEFGYDRLFGFGLMILPVSIGWTTAMTNPFTVQIAQNIAELPMGSGMGFRVIMFLVGLVIGFSFLMYYGRKIKKEPSRSIMKDDPFELPEDLNIEKEKLQRKHILILLAAVTLFAMILYAVQTMGWGLIEMAGGFFAVGLVTIVISGMSGEDSMKAFIKGLELMIVPALVVGFARGIQVVMQEGMIIDTILHHTANGLEKMPKLLAMEGMFLFQSVLNFFIPSASGQALVSMPLMVPLSDLLSISRQSAVLAFILGDGISNLIIPTNGYLMAVLAIAGVPYEKFVKFVFPLFFILMIMAFIFMFIAIKTGY